MNKQLLKEILQREGFREGCYDLEGGLLSERLTLGNEAGGGACTIVNAVFHRENGTLPPKAMRASTC
jgi:hypothetical protein